MTQKETNPVSKKAIRITNFILVAALVIVVAMIVRSWMQSESQRDGDFLGFIIITGAIFAGIAAYDHNRKLRLKYNEWEYRQSVKIIGEPELTITDYFIFSRKYKKRNDDFFTHVYHYVLAGQSLYQVHSFCEEKFKSHQPGPDTIIKAKLIEEDEQLKIIDYVLVNETRLNDYRTNDHGTTGAIAEKFFGSKPSLMNGVESHFGHVQYPRDILTNTIKLALQEEGIKSLVDGDHDRFFFRVNRHFVPVSAQDFLKYKIGETISFTISDWEMPATIQLKA